MDQDAQTTFPPVSQDLIMVTDLSANRYSTDQFQGHLFPSQVLGDDPPIQHLSTTSIPLKTQQKQIAVNVNTLSLDSSLQIGRSKCNSRAKLSKIAAAIRGVNKSGGFRRPKSGVKTSGLRCNNILSPREQGKMDRQYVRAQRNASLQPLPYQTQPQFFPRPEAGLGSDIKVSLQLIDPTHTLQEEMVN